MTDAEKLKAVAEACNIKVVETALGTLQLDDYTGDVFDPRTNFNQAVACLDARFDEWDPHCWGDVKTGKRWYRIAGYKWDPQAMRSKAYEANSCETFGAAAVASILASVEADDE